MLNSTPSKVHFWITWMSLKFIRLFCASKTNLVYQRILNPEWIWPLAYFERTFYKIFYCCMICTSNFLLSSSNSLSNLRSWFSHRTYHQYQPCPSQNNWLSVLKCHNNDNSLPLRCDSAINEFLLNSIFTSTKEWLVLSSYFTINLLTP